MMKVIKYIGVVCMLSVLAGCVESGHDRGVTRAVFCIVI